MSERNKPTVIKLSASDRERVRKVAQEQHRRMMRLHERARTEEMRAQAYRGEDLKDLQKRFGFSEQRQASSFAIHLTWALGRSGMTRGGPVRSSNPPRPWKRSPDRFKKFDAPVTNWQVGKGPNARATQRRDELYQRRQERLLLKREAALKSGRRSQVERFDLMIRIEAAAYSAQVHRDAAANICSMRGEKHPLVKECLRKAAVAESTVDRRLRALRDFDREHGARHVAERSNADGKGSKINRQAPLRAGRVVPLKDGDKPENEALLPKLDWPNTNGLSGVEIKQERAEFEDRMALLASRHLRAKEQGQGEAAKRWQLQMMLESAARQIEQASAAASNERTRKGHTDAWADHYGRWRAAVQAFNATAKTWSRGVDESPETFYRVDVLGYDVPDDITRNIDAVNVDSTREPSSLDVQDARQLYKREAETARQTSDDRADQFAVHNRFLDAVMGERGMSPVQAGKALAKGSGDRSSEGAFTRLAIDKQLSGYRRAMDEGRNTVNEAVRRDVKKGLSLALSYRREMETEIGVERAQVSHTGRDTRHDRQIGG